MSTLNHEQARYYLHSGQEQLDAGERAALERHLAECTACRAYAANLGDLQARLTRLMRARWGGYSPGPEIKDRVQARLRRTGRQRNILRFAGSLATPALIVLVAALGWLIARSGPVPSAPSVPVATAPPAETPSSAADSGGWPAPSGLATFGDRFRLLGYELTSDYFPPGSSVHVTLIWQTRESATSQVVFLNVLDAGDDLVAQLDAPLAGETCDTPNRSSPGIVLACYAIPLPVDLAAGRYRLAAGVYDPAGGARLLTGDGRDSVTLTAIDVGPAGPAPPPAPTVSAEPGATPD